MSESGKRFLLETRTGTPITVRGMTIRPQSRVIGLRWPGGGFVWNRPFGIQVERDGQTEEHRIIDVTRFARVFLYAFAILLPALLWAQMVKERRD